MENKYLLENIKSKYIFGIISSYIKDKNALYKLFVYSKLFQKKFDIEMFYFEKYLNEVIEWEKYLCYTNEWDEIKEFNKDKLRKEMEKSLLEYNNIKDNIIQKIIINYFEKNLELVTSVKEIRLIDFFCPFFDILMKTDNFDKIFTILITSSIIKKYDLKNDYCLKFDEIHKSNIKYSSIQFCYKEFNDLEYLTQFKIDFNQLKELFLHQRNYDYFIHYDKFFKKLFSFFNIKNNLVHLETKILAKDVDSTIIDEINEFKLLENLKLNGFYFETPAIFKLYNLKKLYLIDCRNIGFEENSLSNLKRLDIDDTKIIKTALIKLPEMDEMKIKESYSSNDYNLIFDFLSFKKLKYFEGPPNYFFLLKNSLLEKVILCKQEIYNSTKLELDVLTNLISIKTLKEFSYILKKVNDNDISTINGENTSITKFNLIWANKEFEPCLLNNLQKIFPNLTEIKVYASFAKINDCEIRIEENPLCKINDIKVELSSCNIISFYCQSYDKIKSVYFDINYDIRFVKLNFPIFKKKNQIIFKSLLSFTFHNREGYDKTEVNKINSSFLNSLFNNIENMPNLKYFEISGRVKNNIKDNFYKNFINKVLSLKFIKRVKINIYKDDSKEYFSKNELKEILPDINLNKFFIIKIRKLQSDAKKVGSEKACLFI